MRRRNAIRRGLQDWFVCDIDAHHVETVSWKEIVTYIEDPVVRDNAIRFQNERLGAPPYGLNGDLGLRYQSVGGRIPHQDGQRETVEETGVHRDVTLTRRAMDSLGIDNMVVFPTPMLFLGMHPQPEMEVWLGNAYNRWLIDRILSEDDRIKSLILLPFNTPEEAERTVKEFADKKGVIGFCVTSTRNKPVHHNDYMRLYSHDRGDRQAARLPCRLSLAGSVAGDRQPLPRHACAGLRLVQHGAHDQLDPERDSGAVSETEVGVGRERARLGAVPDAAARRPVPDASLGGAAAEALPSEYMNSNCFYTTQPMETTHPKALENTLEMIKAETQLLFSSDWPHFDFDLPQEICDLPFLSEQAKRNILGLNAARIFNLDPTPVKKLVAA